MSRKTDYKKLYRKEKKKNVAIQNQSFAMNHRLMRSTQLIIVLREIIDKYIPAKKKEAFKKELDKRVKDKMLDIE